MSDFEDALIVLMILEYCCNGSDSVHKSIKKVTAPRPKDYGYFFK